MYRESSLYALAVEKPLVFCVTFTIRFLYHDEQLMLLVFLSCSERASSAIILLSAAAQHEISGYQTSRDIKVKWPGARKITGSACVCQRDQIGYELDSDFFRMAWTQDAAGMLSVGIPTCC